MADLQAEAFKRYGASDGGPPPQAEPDPGYDDATLRELFVLLCTEDRLFVTLEPA